MQLCLEIIISSKLTQPLTVVKGERRKPDRKPYPLHYGLRNPYRNLKSKESQDFAPEISKKLYFHEFGFRSPPVLVNLRTDVLTMRGVS
jgi:hypothetical protein